MADTVINALFDGVQEKTCTRCLEKKLILLFSIDKRWGSPLSQCKKCRSDASRDYARRNPEKIKARNDNLTPEKRASNTAKQLDKYKSDPEFAKRAKDRAKKWYEENREAILTKMSSADGRKYSRENMRKKMKDDSFRLHSNISRAIRASIKDKNGRSWQDIVGYTIEDLLAHLERQFLPGMTFENHGMGEGKWNIDHILPRSSFSFSNSDDLEFKACWSLANLRPMWAIDNIQKSAKSIYLI